MSFRGKNPSRPSNTGFKVVPAHAPHSAYLGKAKKLKESLIERAKIKKSFAKALKREGLQSERLGRGSEGHTAGTGLGSGAKGRGSAVGRGRGASTSSRGTGRKAQGVMAKDGVRELVQLSRQSKTAGVSKPTAVESESDESELESGEERAPRTSKKAGAGVVDEQDDDDEADDGFFDDAVDADMIDSKVSLSHKGKGRADPSDERDEREPKRSRERSRAGPAPGSDNDEDEEEEVFLPYTAQRGRGQATSRGRGGPSARGSTNGRGRGSSGSASSSTTVYGAGTPRPWGTDGLATMTTTTRPKGKKDAGNPNFTFLGRDSTEGAPGPSSTSERGGRAARGGTGGERQRTSWKERDVPREVVPVVNEPFRGKPLHTHTPTTSTSTLSTSTATSTANPDRSLRDLKRTAYLGPAKSSSVVHPGRTNREVQKQQKEQQQHQQQRQHGQPGGQGQRRGSQPRLGARMGALLQEIERRAT